MLLESNCRAAIEMSDLNQSQSELAEKLIEMDEKDGVLVNLHGPSSSTTDIGRAIAKEEEWSYYPWYNPEKIDPSGTKALIDNVPSTREASRRVRELITFDGYSVVVAISEEKLPEAHHYLRIETESGVSLHDG